MNGKNLFIDTNIILYLIQGDGHVAELLNGKNLFVSFITEIELLSFSKLTARELGTIQALLADVRIVHSNPDITQEVVRIMATHRLKLPDAIIAGTAHYMHLPLLTSDTGIERLGPPSVIPYMPVRK